MENDPSKSKLLAIGKFGPLRSTTNNHRFATYRGTNGSDPVFVKIAIEPRLRERFVVEADGMRTLAHMDPASKLYKVPQLVELNPEYIATEWIDGSPMSDVFETSDTQKIKSYMLYLTDLFAFFDKFPGGRGETRFHVLGEKPKTTQAIEKLQELHAERVIDMDLVQKVADYVDAVLPITETRYQHGDLQPGNILIDDKNTPAIIDFETCSPLWPRHYNIVNFVFNYQQRYPEYQHELAQAFWAYCEKTKVNATENIAAFNVSAAMRCLQMLIEKHLDSRRSEHPINDNDIMYISTTMQAVMACKLFITQ